MILTSLFPSKSGLENLNMQGFYKLWAENLVSTEKQNNPLSFNSLWLYNHGAHAVQKSRSYNRFYIRLKSRCYNRFYNRLQSRCYNRFYIRLKHFRKNW